MIHWHRLYPSALALALLAAGFAAPFLPSAKPTYAAAPAPEAPRADVKALNLPPTLPSATGYQAVDMFPNMTFVQPLSIVTAPGEKNRLFIVSKTGTIEVINNLDGKNGGPTKTTFLDLNPYLQQKNMVLGQTVEWGLMGLAFHPDFAKNGYFYITYDPTVRENNRQVGFDRVSRFSVSKTDPNKADMNSELVYFTSLDPANNHNGGCIIFGPDGYLYTSVGDGGGANDQYNNASFIDKSFFAAIYRIDVDNNPGNLEPNPLQQNSTTFPSAINLVNGKATYRIPKDNPLVGITKYFGRDVDPKKVRTEIYANGLRNAWRFRFDDPTGRLFCAEIGQDAYEEIDIITKGGNYGWPYRESLHDGPRRQTMPPEAKLLDPIYEYGHGNRSGQFSGNSISGGLIYRGSNLTELTGKYIFGDYNSRRMFAITESNGKWTPVVLANNVGQPVEVAPDPRNGDILFADIGNVNSTQATGHIKKLVRTGVQGPQPPSQLSMIGVFKDFKTLTPADGLIPYEPNVTFWSDYALKQRWFMIPNAKDTITFDATNNWKFPDGMVWVKHFDMEMTRGDASTKRRLETRFIVKTKDNVYGLTYKWRADNSDADLVPEAGLDEVLTINDHGTQKKQTWHYPSQSECLQCHTSLAGGALAFNTYQLNGKGHGTENQLQMLKNAGYFDASTSLPDPKSLGAYAKADDASASLEWRVRSYLAVNCVQCHQPGGIVQGYWDARVSTGLDSAKIVNGELVATRGDAAAKVVVPGDAAHSMLYQRVRANNVPRMPPLASNELDPSADALLRQWIDSLKK